MINRLSAILLIAVGATLIVYAAPVTFFTYSSFRLPTNVIPSNYNITLKPDLEKFKFEGYVDITLKVTKNPTKAIILHWYDLTLVNLVFFETSGEIITTSAAYWDTVREFIIIVFDKELAMKSYRLQIDYIGTLNTEAVGLFRRSYVNDRKQIRWFVASNFEPIYARRAFPCFDEPAIKATFDINIARYPEDVSLYHSISNMKLSHTSWDRSREYVIDVFEQTPVMSTYLLSFVVCDFTYFSTEDRKIRLYTRNEIIGTTEPDFAIQMSSRIIQKLESYTQIPFSLKKLDQIAIPDLNFIATENWGSIIYNEDDILWNDRYSTAKSKQKTLMTMSHEFAHQWIGNLVTPIWWQYLWFKEGLATVIGLHVIESIKPEWRIKEQFVENMHNCFMRDSERIKPLSSDVARPTEIEEKFNSISNYKAGVVLHMFEHMITPDYFRKAIVRLLKEKEYGVTNSSDLYNAIQEVLRGPMWRKWNFVAIFPFPTALRKWEKQSGYPVVTVTRNYPSGDVHFSQVTLTQNIFHIDGTVPKDTSTWWYIPINWYMQHYEQFENTRGNIWIFDEPHSFSMQHMVPASWLIVNNKGTGYYRVNYDERNWKLLADYLYKEDYEKKIHPMNRARLIDDAFNLARAGLLKYEIAFNMTNYLHRETDYIVHSSFFRVFNFLDIMIGDHPLYDKFQRRIVTILEKTLDKLGYDEVKLGDEEHINNMHRHDLIYWSCLMKSEKCLKVTNQKLEYLLGNANNLQMSPVCGALRPGDLTIWDSVDAFIQRLDSRIQKRYKYILGCSENHEILKQYLERESNQNNLEVFENIYNKGNFGKRFVRHYFYTNFNAIFLAFKDNTSKIIVGLSSLLTTEDDLSKFSVMKSTYDFPGLESSFVTAIKNIKANLKWAKQYLPDVATWLNTLP